jgi:hypothetical protein
MVNLVSHIKGRIYRLVGLENWTVLEKMFGTIRQDVIDNTETYIMRSFIILSVHQTLTEVTE